MIKREQLAQHVSEGDCWLLIRGHVFDVSEYMKSHPGGRWVMLKAAGGDATEAFEQHCHSEVALEIMQDLIVGALEPS
jgi:cytochrome b involved in lipid metabolism